MKVYGQLEKAQLENLALDPTGDDLYEGRVWYNTVDTTFKFYDGSVVKSYALLEALVADLNTLTGVAANDTDLGTFTGSTITDNSTIKTALQELETKVEYGGSVYTRTAKTAYTIYQIPPAYDTIVSFSLDAGPAGVVSIQADLEWTLPGSVYNNTYYTFYISRGGSNVATIPFETVSYTRDTAAVSGTDRGILIFAEDGLTPGTTYSYVIRCAKDSGPNTTGNAYNILAKGV